MNGEYPTYEELVALIQDAPLTWLPGILAKTIEAIRTRNVFQPGAIVRFVEQAEKRCDTEESQTI